MKTLEERFPVLAKNEISKIKEDLVNSMKEVMVPFGIACFLEGRKTSEEYVNEGWIEYQVKERLDAVSHLLSEE